ncbi:MAG: hypothetical protein WCV93_01010 [Candidatus Shapirobacteria bacterium]|jgi:hypothetical protein
MAGSEADNRIREAQQREAVLRDRERSEQTRLIRAERTRHDAIGVAGRILDARIRTPDVIQPELVGFVAVAAAEGDAISPYEAGPIRSALLIRAMSGNVERVQAGLVAERDREMEGMMMNPLLVSALHKYSAIDPDILDRPVEMTADEWKLFGDYQVVKDERQAIVDSMTNGVAGLYDDREDLQRRVAKLGARLEDLRSRAGSLGGAEKTRYEELLTKMFKELRGPEAANYSRWAGMDQDNLRPEEAVMLADVWGKMMRALDGGEEGELEELRERKVRALRPEEQRLYDKRLGQLRSKITDAAELAEFNRLMAIPSYKRTKDETETLEMRLELVAEDAGIRPAEMTTFEKLKERAEGAVRLTELEAKKARGALSTGERGEFEDLRSRAGLLTEAETGSIGVIDGLVTNLRGKIGDINRQIREKTEHLGESSEWMKMVKAFDGMVTNINVTDQWRKAWHDYGAGAQESFTQTRWAEYQRVSDLVALMEMPMVGVAMQTAFRAMCLIGLNRTGDVAGSANIMQMEKLTEQQVQERFVEPCRGYVKQALRYTPDLYVNFGVEMARMLFENGFCAGWLCVERGNDGNIMYRETVVERNGNLRYDDSSDFGSVAYRYGVPKVVGDGTVYADRQNDYIKPAATRAKQMKEYSKGYETGLPALIPVLPDNLSQPWVSHQEMLAIANGRVNLADVFRTRPDNSRWGWTYGIFRGGQVYELVSKFIIGLKGYRGVGEEVDFFFNSPANMGSVAKKIDVALNYSLEARRLRMNLFMAAVYAIDDDAANPERSDQLKTVLSDMTKAPEKRWLNFQKDDYRRAFVRNGFLTEEEFNYAWGRIKNILPGDGGKAGSGLIKKSEEAGLARLNGSGVQRRDRRLADQV